MADLACKFLVIQEILYLEKWVYSLHLLFFSALIIFIILKRLCLYKNLNLGQNLVTKTTKIFLCVNIAQIFLVRLSLRINKGIFLDFVSVKFNWNDLFPGGKLILILRHHWEIIYYSFEFMQAYQLLLTKEFWSEIWSLFQLFIHIASKCTMILIFLSMILRWN